MPIAKSVVVENSRGVEEVQTRGKRGEVMEVCSEHQTVVTDLAIIKNDLKYIKNKVCSHIQEGEEKGGFRDRLIVTEMEVKTIKKEISELKKAEWTRLIVAGCVGGLIGNITPEFIQMFVGWVVGK